MRAAGRAEPTPAVPFSPVLLCRSLHVVAQSEEALGVPQSGLFFMPRGRPAGPGKGTPGDLGAAWRGWPGQLGAAGTRPPVQAAWPLSQ